MNLREQENSGSSEVLKDEWEPTITLRPHHLLREETTKAFLGRDIKGLSLAKYLAIIAYPIPWLIVRSDKTGYRADVMGRTMVDAYRFIRSCIEVEKLLNNLSDDEKVQLDIGPDPICEACVVGKHCTATNFQSEGQGPLDNIGGEASDIFQINIRLLMGGYKEGKDFIFRKTNHVFVNYNGQDLNAQTGLSEEIVEFDFLIVKVGVLRNILKSDSSES